MSYEPYADSDYYANTYKGNTLPTNDQEIWLNKASRNIDTLTFNRILEVGFDNLTEFQKEIIQNVNCQLADFQFINQDLLNSLLSSYAINGVNMKFDNNITMTNINGIILPSEVYDLLSQTGLTCLNMRW